MAHFYEENGILRVDFYRGDTGNFMMDRFRQEVDGADVPVNLIGMYDEIRWQVKEFPGAKDFQLEKTLLDEGIQIVDDSDGNEGAALQFIISAEETAELGSGNYVADLEFTLPDGMIQTAKTVTSDRIWKIVNKQDVTV